MTTEGQVTNLLLVKSLEFVFQVKCYRQTDRLTNSVNKVVDDI